MEKSVGAEEDEAAALRERIESMSVADVLAPFSEQNRLQVPQPRVQVLSSEDMFPATPDRMVTKLRGKKTFGGPALSLMQHMQWKMTMRTMDLSALDESRASGRSTASSG